MPNPYRDVLARIERELSKYPVEYVFGHGGKHPFVDIRHSASGRSARVYFPGSPGSSFVGKQAAGVLRRAIRAMGVSAHGDHTIQHQSL
jgi:hypothetical protein